MSTVDLIVCTYNNEKIIGECLDSIRAQSYKNYTCTVIDDNSSDGTVEFIRKTYPWVKIIRKNKGSGPAVSRNLGIKATKGEYIATFDSDVVLDKNWIKDMVSFMEDHPDCGLCASKLLLPNKKINAAGGSMTKIGIGFDLGSNQEQGKFSKQKEVLYACSAAMLMRREMVNNIGLFDERFYFCHEDTDFGLRANLCGYRVIYNPNATAHHNVHTTIGKIKSKTIFENNTRNKIRTLIKNYETKSLLKYLPLAIIMTMGDIVFRKHKIPKLKGLLWNLWNLDDNLKERRRIQKIRKVRDKEIFKLFSPHLLK